MQQRPREDRRRPDSRIWTDLLAFRPTDADVDALIARASADSLVLGPRHRSGR